LQKKVNNESDDIEDEQSTLKEIFPYLQNFQAKYKQKFGPLLNCLTGYLRNDDYGMNGFIGSSQQNLQLLFDMGKAALWAENG